MNEEIDVFKCLDYIRDNSKKYAYAKANRVYIEEYRRTLKASLMSEAMINGVEAISAQERDALSHQDYAKLLLGLKEAIALEEDFGTISPAAAQIETTIGVVLLPGIPPIECLSTISLFFNFNFKIFPECSIELIR